MSEIKSKESPCENNVDVHGNVPMTTLTIKDAIEAYKTLKKFLKVVKRNGADPRKVEKLKRALEEIDNELKFCNQPVGWKTLILCLDDFVEFIHAHAQLFNNAKLSVPLWLLRRLNGNADRSVFFSTALCQTARCFLVSARLCFLLPSKIFLALRKELLVLVLQQRPILAN
ncbi:hypothetical protein T05_15678 [Trichinella murrelli]|uniref:Uncharacterized protein n=1 Tax=Trichinella murrelli TaxID=144512 RepID=A0A0V0TD48_9BILA|nr:hypothetical protein T05_15678 [Trichinella murrelli]